MKKYLLCYIVFCFCVFQVKAQDNKDVVLGNGVQIDKRSDNVQTDYIPALASGQDAFIYPNPATDHVWLVLSADTREIYRVILFDINGTILSHQDYQVEPGVHKYNVILPSWNTNIPLFLRATTPGKQQEKIFRILRN